MDRITKLQRCIRLDDDLVELLPVEGGLRIERARDCARELRNELCELINEAHEPDGLELAFRRMTERESGTLPSWGGR